MNRDGRFDYVLPRWPLRAGGRPYLPPAADIVISDALADTVRLIDDAHRVLSSEDLAGLLVAVRALSAKLSEGRALPRPADRLDEDRVGLSSAARVYLRPINVCLYRASRGSGPEQAATLVRLAARLEDHLDEVAARPKGRAVT